MTADEIKKVADIQRKKAKELFGECIGRSGYDNDKYPMSRFVDAVINAAVLEVLLSQQAAMEQFKESK